MAMPEFAENVVVKHTFAQLVDDLPQYDHLDHCDSDFEVDYRDTERSFWSSKRAWKPSLSASDADTCVPSHASDSSASQCHWSEASDIEDDEQALLPAFTVAATTVMLRNLPNNITRQGLLELFNSMGFYGQYDFVYLPIDFSRRASRGYAFVNLASEQSAQSFFAAFQGFSRWTGESKKVCEVIWSEEQGLDFLIERYRNSPLMHERIPDECRPAIFFGGERVTFPRPTRQIRRPQQPKWLRSSRSQLSSYETSLVQW